MPEVDVAGGESETDLCVLYADDTQSDIGVESRLRKSTSKIGTGMKNPRRKQTWQSAT